MRIRVFGMVCLELEQIKVEAKIDIRIALHSYIVYKNLVKLEKVADCSSERSGE